MKNILLQNATKWAPDGNQLLKRVPMVFRVLSRQVEFPMTY